MPVKAFMTARACPLTWPIGQAPPVLAGLTTGRCVVLLTLTMRTQQPVAENPPPGGASPSSHDAPDPAGRLRSALAAAAAAAVAADLDLEAWMQAAWAAYVDQRPGLRDHLEDVRLSGQLDELRRQGKVGQA